MHTNPMTSDGNWTIGYDDDGIAGQWDGNMSESCDDRDFITAQEHHTFHDGTEEYHIEVDQNGTLYWANAENYGQPIDEILRAHGV